MSIKINLLPDVRQEKLQEKQRRQLAATIAIATGVVGLALIVVGFVIVQGQNLRIALLTRSIRDKKQQVASFQDVGTILSLQGRVAALPQLYSQRTYMTELTSILSTHEPSDVAFTNLTIASQQLTLSAEAKSYLAAARIAKAMEAAASSDQTKFFSNVQLSSVTLNNGKVAYTITATINSGATDGK
ncbi:MAG TPA: PilN domain-containing protein [Candidatus Saccharimonadales bacterium]|nr:PilN domain-containing protein [Candidatus Saccharimonadales bacterium]